MNAVVTYAYVSSNLMAYMERKDMNVFDVLPVTFFIRPGGLPHENEMQEFTAFFNMIAARNAQQKDRELAAAKKKSAVCLMIAGELFTLDSPLHRSLKESQKTVRQVKQRKDQGWRSALR